jgi:hypothetical protein
MIARIPIVLLSLLPVFVHAQSWAWDDGTVPYVQSRPAEQAFRGQVSGDRIEGEVAITNGEETRTLPWTASRAK